jgi:hypothetical protein
MCKFQFFEGLSAVVLGHLYLLEFARDFCVCTYGAYMCNMMCSYLLKKKNYF